MPTDCSREAAGMIQETATLTRTIGHEIEVTGMIQETATLAQMTGHGPEVADQIQERPGQGLAQVASVLTQETPGQDPAQVAAVQTAETTVASHESRESGHSHIMIASAPTHQMTAMSPDGGACQPDDHEGIPAAGSQKSCAPWQGEKQRR